MKGNLLGLLLGLFVSVGYAADVSWKCDWFGIDCPQGDQNQVLLDLGRQSTNTGFLFLEGDSAEIRKTIELTFSKRSVSKRDRLFLKVRNDGLPEGSLVSIDGMPCLAPFEAEIIATSEVVRAEILWVIPPSGEDVNLEGGIEVRPEGFERAGSLTLSKSAQKPIEMLRVQGTANDDWHWVKRLNFWFWTILTFVVFSLKWGLAPVVFPRFKFVFVDIVITEEEFGAEKVLCSERLRMRGRRSFSVGKGFEKPSWLSDWLWGRSGAKKIDGIVNGGFVLRSGGKSRYKANRPSGNMIRVIDLEGSALSHVYQFNSKLKVKIGSEPRQFLEFKEIK